MAQGLLLAKSKNKCTDDILDEKLNSIVDQIERISKIIAHLRHLPDNQLILQNQ